MGRTVALLLVLLSAAAWARDNAPAWVEVRSEHFTVVTNAGEKQGRHVIDQFERMRWVFQELFPKMNVDPVSPIVVMAVKNAKDFEALEPPGYQGRGKLTLAGYFLYGAENNYILVRLDTGDEQHPWATVYHEYTHLEIGDAIEWMPLWLNEGLAEFFQNAEIEDKTARLGEPSSDDLMYLQQNRLIPLETLFRIDANSPYYHEEQKGSVFYAESWALTHYLETTDMMNHTRHLAAYAQLVSQHQDPVTAAQTAFGDLKKLQDTLELYIRRGVYQYFRLSTPPLNEAEFTVTPLSAPQADALRAEILAHVGRTEEARTVLDAVLKDDPKNVQAHETMGFLEFRAGHLDEAKKWYGEAVALDSHSYQAQYSFASLSLRQGDTSDAVEKSLRSAIALNPRFAPAYDSLAVLYGRRREKLDEAHMLALQAVQLEPGNIHYRLDTAHILLEQEKYDDSTAVLRAAAAMAKSPLEVAVVQRMLEQVQQQRAEAEQWKGGSTQAPGTVHTTVILKGSGRVHVDASNPALPELQHPTETPHGAMMTAEGVIHGVHCSYPVVIELQLEGAGKKLSLYNNNYYHIDYSASNFTPQGDIHPCQELEGMKAKVDYFATADKTVDGQIVSIEMSK